MEREQKELELQNFLNSQNTLTLHNMIEPYLKQRTRKKRRAKVKLLSIRLGWLETGRQIQQSAERQILNFAHVGVEGVRGRSP